MLQSTAPRYPDAKHRARDFGSSRISPFCRRVSTRSPLLPIFLIVLVDVLGYTIIFPVLAFYVKEFGASDLVATSIVSVYAACSLISTPIIGRLSDQYGRRRLLLLSQSGTCLGFLLLGSATSLWMVFAGRILDGLTAGNLSIAQAYISDHTKPENRAKAFGVIGIAFGVGFVFGPVLGGVLLADHGHQMPFLVAAGLSALSIVCTYVLLPHELPPKTVTADAGPAGRRPGAFDVSTYAEYFRRPGLGAIYLQFFLFTFAFSLLTSGFALFAKGKFGWDKKEVGYFFAYVGALGVILQGGLLGRLVKKFGERSLTRAGFVSLLIAYPLLSLSSHLTMLAIAATFASFGNGVLRPALTSRITKSVGRHEQGVALGLSGSLSSIAMIISPLTGGTMLELDWLLAWALIPAAVAAVALVVGAVSAQDPSVETTHANTRA
ncbi:MAG: MFS transporter [Kofleriaceae bacterium]